MKTLIAVASTAGALCAFAGAAQAQTIPAGVYGTLGYSDAHSNNTDLGAIQGKLGYRIMPYAGIEGELAFGVRKDDFTVGNALPGQKGHTELKHAEAIYGVGFLPLSPNTDLLARVGYGSSRERVTLPDRVVAGGGATPSTSASASQDSWNFGVGAQHHFDGKNGVRVDYTRQEFTKDSFGHADVYAVAYTRKF